MAKSFHLEIITPSKTFYRGQCEMVIVPTPEGQEGFMAAFEQAGHERDVTGTGTHAGGVILEGHFGAVADIVLSQVGLKGRMIQHFGNVLEGDGHDVSSLS